MQEAILYKKLKQNKVQCQVCHHFCIISPNKKGICGVRRNQNGILYSLVYGKAISEAIDPIEKKPFFHFLPGSKALSIATIGCNFRCTNCQNWQISQASKLQPEVLGQDLPPDQIVKDALENDCASIAYTYTEPTIFLEYALATMQLAKKQGLKNVWVSNGYMSNLTLKKISGYLDAINIDLKFFDNKSYLKNCGGQLEPILNNLQWLKNHNIHLEVTTLSIPTLSDSEKMFEQIAKFIRIKLGADTPWHLSAFSPDISYKLNDLSPTPVTTLERARQIGLDQGLRYVYLGNVAGHQAENTSCPKCGKIVINRNGYNITRYDKQGYCPFCHEKLALIT